MSAPTAASPPSFCDLTAVTERAPVDDRRVFDVTVPDGWQQGAGAFGGFVLAVLVRAIEACVPGRALRSLTAEIPAPVRVGGATVSVEVLRTGQSVTVVAARLVQNGELHAHAVAVLGAPRALEGAVDHVELVRPTTAGWRDVPAIPPDLPNVPVFARHFEFRLLDGAPFSGRARSGATGWIRLREPGPVKDAALVVAHVDAWWPAEFSRMTAPRPMVTSAFSMQVVGGAAAWKTDAPLLHTSRTLAVRDGYVTEMRELWTETGELVGLNEQTMVIVK
jgi:acyl-CoA thioesterase